MTCHACFAHAEVFGAVLYELRTDRGFSQEIIGEQAGFRGPNRIWDFENSRFLPQEQRVLPSSEHQTRIIIAALRCSPTNAKRLLRAYHADILRKRGVVLDRLCGS